MLTETKLSYQVELYGLMAQFSQPEPLVRAARLAYAARLPAHGCLFAHAGGWLG